MSELFYMGGYLFMSIITLIGLVMFSWSIFKGIQVFNGKESPSLRHQVKYIKSIGTLALITGILGQLIGLYSAFDAIEKAGAISPGTLAAGLKVSSITTLYGMMIFILAYLCWFLIDSKLNSQNISKV